MKCLLLKGTQKEACRDQTCKAPNHAAARHDGSPAEHQYTEICRWSLESEKNSVARDFTKDIRHKEDHGGNVEITAFHLQASFQSLDLCIADIGSPRGIISIRWLQKS